MTEHDGFVQLTLDSIRRSQVSKLRVILLKENNGERFLPVWISGFDAQSLISAIKCKQLSPSPLNFFSWLIWAGVWILGLRQSRYHPFKLRTDFNARFSLVKGNGIQQVVISDIVEDFYVAEVLAKTTSGYSKAFALRPSDAIILAERYDKPIYVLKKILNQAGIVPTEEGE